MISVTELRAGTTFEEDGNFFTVISYEHNKVGRGSANVKVKVRNLKSGTIVEKSYASSGKMQDVPVTKKDMQFLYKDDEFLYFMDPQTYEQVTMLIKLVPDHIYLKEGDEFNISFLQGEPLSISFPPKMTFRVVETAPGVKGNSATNVFKEAILENGLKTRVPLFIDTNELIRVDTRDGSYAEKAQS